MANPRVLIWNKIVFKKSSLKTLKSGIFLSKSKGFYFNTRYCNRRNTRVQGPWFHTWQYYFQNCYTKHPNRACLVLDLRIFIFVRHFEVRRVRGCWFQIWHSKVLIFLYGNSFSKLLLKISNMAILFSNSKYFDPKLNFSLVSHDFF